MAFFPSKEESSVQSLSRVWLFGTPWTAARQASLSITNSRSLFKLKSIALVMPANHLIFCHPLLLPPSILPSIRVFSNESVLLIRWPKYSSFNFSISPSNEYSGLIPLWLTGWIFFSPRDSQESSPTPQFKSINSSVLSFLYSPTPKKPCTNSEKLLSQTSLNHRIQVYPLGGGSSLFLGENNLLYSRVLPLGASGENSLSHALIRTERNHSSFETDKILT